MGMDQMLKAVIRDMEMNELQLALLGIVLWIQNGTKLTQKDLEEIIDEAKRS